MDRKIGVMFKTKANVDAKTKYRDCKLDIPVNNYKEIISESKKYKSRRFHEN